jgi:hypothetical protein
VRRYFTYAAAGLLSGLWLLNAGAAEPQASGPTGAKVLQKVSDPVCTTGTCSGDYGTSVHFVKTPSEAAKQAQKEEKLVLVLHISGLFENPEFT